MPGAKGANYAKKPTPLADKHDCKLYTNVIRIVTPKVGKPIKYCQCIDCANLWEEEVDDALGESGNSSRDRSW